MFFTSIFSNIHSFSLTVHQTANNRIVSKTFIYFHIGHFSPKTDHNSELLAIIVELFANYIILSTLGHSYFLSFIIFKMDDSFAFPLLHLSKRQNSHQKFVHKTYESLFNSILKCMDALIFGIIS